MSIASKVVDHQTATLLEAAIDKHLDVIQSKDIDDRDLEHRVAARRQLINPNDTLALERIIGERDLMGISFLVRGAQAAKAVCRIRIRNRFGNPEGHGTGFLVAPGLLLTNNHVLRNADTAAHSIAEFDYELDEFFVPRKVRQFSLTPERVFFTNSILDFTFVGVAPFASDDTPLADYSRLQLIPHSGKAVDGEWVTIVQHPNGEMKQIVIRESQIVILGDDIPAGRTSSFIYYTTDTERGSSGAPVLNDQWDVVALHHKAVPKYDDEGNILALDGERWHESMGEDRVYWIANEGVRISGIYRALIRSRSDDQARKVIGMLTTGGYSDRRLTTDLMTPVQEVEIAEGLPFEATSFEGIKGYDQDFLDIRVALPKVVGDWADDVAALDNGGKVLKYRNFSVVMSISRRLAYLTAVNINGKKLQKPTKSPSWRTDPRLDKSLQSDNALYKNDPSEEFDLQRGHLIRRLDPVWGDSIDEVNEAVNHTYHYTNAAPQERDFNNTVWGDLEDFILQRAIETDHRVTVFSGPIFDDINDPFYRHTAEGGPYQIPMEYWKVVVFMKSDGTPSATAYKQNQFDVLPFLEAGLTTHGFHPLSEFGQRQAQLRITDLEEITSIDFGNIKRFDPMGGIEATIVRRPILGPEDLLL